MRSKRSQPTLCALALACGLAGCFYDWRYKPGDGDGDGDGDGGAGSGGASASGGGAGAPDPGACSECVDAFDRQCSTDTACEDFEVCAAAMGCEDLLGCVACYQDDPDGFNQWTCLYALCGDACTGLPIPCG